MRVLDLSAFAVGPWAASCLSSLGADVIKVDPPYGDPIRRVQPRRHGEPTTYTVCNLGKRLIALDLKSEEAHRRVRNMAAEADVIVENHRAGAMDRLRLGYQDVRRYNPGIVYCSSGSFGDRGPMAGVGSTDPNGQAFGGFVSLNGADPNHPEFLRYSALVDLCTATFLVGGALFGLEQRARAGCGCHVVTSQMEAVIAIQLTRLAEYFATGVVPLPMGSASSVTVPSGAFLCLDRRYLCVSAPSPPSWTSLCQVLGLAELAADPRFATNRARIRNRQELSALLEGSFRKADLHWWAERLTEAGVPCAALNVLDDALAWPGAHPLGHFLVDVAHPVAGRMVVPRPPWEFERTPATLRAAALPGTHDELTGAFAAGEPAPAEVAPRDSSPAAPLAGLRVLEIAMSGGGAYCGWLLAGLGAEVLKLRQAPEPDGGGTGHPELRHLEAGLIALNDGKLEVRLDWRSEEGRRRLKELIASAEVVLIDRGRHGLEEPISPSDGDLRSDPRTIVCGISPAGETGPMAHLVASELEIQALSGLLRYLGQIGEAPVRIGADVAGAVSGMMGFVGVLAAIFERRRSGFGQYVAVSGVGSLVALGSVMVAAIDQPDEWEGFHCRAAATPPIHGIRTQDGFISFSAPKLQENWEAFCRAFRADALLDDPRFATDDERTFRRPELLRALEPFLESHRRQEIIGLANRLDAIAVPIQDYDQLLSHPQVVAMDVVSVGPQGRSLAVPWKIDGERPKRAAAPFMWPKSGSG